MTLLEKSPENPIVRPRYEHEWEDRGTFNASVVWDGSLYHMLYRAQSSEQPYRGAMVPLSTIGYASSRDGVSFSGRRQFIVPENEWEAFGCEDPRVTLLDDTYFVFYTALSMFPFSPPGIRVGVALTKDFQTVDEKHPVTSFNSKAMALFPARVGGRIAAVLTADTDVPPAKIGLALFDDVSDIWSPRYWHHWYAHLDSHVLPVLRSSADQVEVGAVPIETDRGWLLLYADIRGYRLEAERRVFGIEALLLDRDDPSRILGRTQKPLLVPDAAYEMRGFVPRVAFPSGALTRDGTLMLYYGAADTSVALATGSLDAILDEIRTSRHVPPSASSADRGTLTRHEGNPIIAPRAELEWESRATFNPAAVLVDGRVHILYRALDDHDTSTIGYATSLDGVNIDERLTEPVYVPREPFEHKSVPGGGSGCEDARATIIDDRLYMLYTAFNSYDARVALSSISVEDFLARRWVWEKPILISPPEVWDKNASLFPRRIGGNFAVLHRLSLGVWIDLADDLRAFEQRWLGGRLLIAPRPGRWDNRKVGAAAPPIETSRGWLLLYHGIEDPGTIYRVGALVLDRDDPTKVLARSEDPILEPRETYEREGLIRNVVFPCGAVVKDGRLLVYYGGADHVVGVATGDPEEIAAETLRNRTFL